MNTVVVLGANSFSGQDFVDLMLDDPQYRVVGVSRSPERSGLFLKYRLRKDLSRYAYHAMDMNRDMGPLLAMLVAAAAAMVTMVIVLTDDHRLQPAPVTSPSSTASPSTSVALPANSGVPKASPGELAPGTYQIAHFTVLAQRFHHTLAVSRVLVAAHQVATE